ncbi:ABC transporter ATP-binding protein [Cardiobacteriaceae bacterium TAE3-ERU3]|nr:ABC transporter ATP-binding protein [Cardiobacteriaceae bacterium TAE3-ERU3]
MSEVALEIRGLRKTYRGGFEAVKNIDLTVKQGDFYALLGPNGAGKSTTISMITSLTRKTSGTIRIFEHDIDEDFSAAKSCIGLVPQEFNLNVFERCIDVVRNQAGFYNLPSHEAKERAELYLEQLGLADKREEQTRNLSGGMKRRLMIARAMAHEPKLLILDEPTAGVDIEIRRSMWHFLEKINDEGTSIILTTHYLEEAEQLCRRIGVINHGEIVYEGEMRSLLAGLEQETFIFDINIISNAIEPIAGYTVKQVDAATLEVSIAKGQSLNSLFSELDKQGIEVLSMRNKVNRLEELFMQLVE